MYYTRTQPWLLPGSHGTVTLNTRTRSGLGDRLFAKLFYGPGFSLAYFFALLTAQLWDITQDPG